MEQRAPIDFILSQPLSETFTVGGIAETVLAAHVQANAGLQNVLGGDPVGAWILKAMDHVYVGGEQGGVQYQAQFVRDPEWAEVE